MYGSSSTIRRTSAIMLLAAAALFAATLLATARPAHAQEGFDFSQPDNAAAAEDAMGGGMVVSTSCNDRSANQAGEPCLTEESTVFHPLGDVTIQGIIGNVIKAILGLVGVIALVMFIYGGLTWMMAAGSQEKITKAKNTLVWAVLGLVMVFAAYALVSFVINAIG